MNKNQQQTERPFLHKEGSIQLHHMFPTIQGEGPFAGVPAIFVRLAGCNLQCPFCDTDYTSQRTTFGPHELAYQVEQLTPPARRNGQLVVITGGEPFRQNISLFARVMLAKGYRVQVETNGTLFLPDFPYDQATIVCSPKTGRLDQSLAAKVHAFKFVVQAGFIDPKDGLPFATLGQVTQHTVARPPAGSKAEIYVQPLDEQDANKNQANTEAAVNSCLTFGYRLCIQTHKLVNLE